MCNDNLLYASTTAEKSSHSPTDLPITKSSTLSCTRNRSLEQNDEDTYVKNIVNNPIFQTQDEGPSPIKQKCSGNRKTANTNTFPNDQKSKTKKQTAKYSNSRNIDICIEREYIGQLESELEKMRSTVELYKKADLLNQGKDCKIDIDRRSNTENSDIKLLEHRMKTLETQMSQNLHLTQLQQAQIMTQLQVQQLSLQQSMWQQQNYLAVRSPQYIQTSMFSCPPRPLVPNHLQYHLPHHMSAFPQLQTQHQQFTSFPPAYPQMQT